MVEFNQESNKWEDVGVERTTYLLKHLAAITSKKWIKIIFTDVVKQNEAAMKEEEKGNFLHNASSNVTGGVALGAPCIHHVLHSPVRPWAF